MQQYTFYTTCMIVTHFSEGMAVRVWGNLAYQYYLNEHGPTLHGFMK